MCTRGRSALFAFSFFVSASTLFDYEGRRLGATFMGCLLGVCSALGFPTTPTPFFKGAVTTTYPVASLPHDLASSCPCPWVSDQLPIGTTKRCPFRLTVWSPPTLDYDPSTGSSGELCPVCKPGPAPSAFPPRPHVPRPTGLPRAMLRSRNVLGRDSTARGSARPGFRGRRLF